LPRVCARATVATSATNNINDFLFIPTSFMKPAKP
jgi:hypothetical protein